MVTVLKQRTIKKTLKKKKYANKKKMLEAIKIERGNLIICQVESLTPLVSFISI
jgi:hypothetical protein